MIQIIDQNTENIVEASCAPSLCTDAPHGLSARRCRCKRPLPFPCNYRTRRSCPRFRRGSKSRQYAVSLSRRRWTGTSFPRQF